MTDQVLVPGTFSPSPADLREGSDTPTAPVQGSQTEPLFNPGRMRLYPLMAVLVYALLAFLQIRWSRDGLGFHDLPLGGDFIAFWAASLLTLQGHAASAFDLSSIFEAERAAVPANYISCFWHYPPTFQLLIMPLALLPYGTAWLVFMWSSLGAYIGALCPLISLRGLGKWGAIVLILGFPGTYIAVSHGQNSLISAALFVGAAIFIKTRPLLAGCFLGLFAFKPQLAWLAPIALIAGGQWRALFAAAATAILFSAAATLVLGFDLWEAFFRDTRLVRDLVQNGWLPWDEIPNAYVFLRMFGVPGLVAFAAQAAMALIAAALVFFVWSRRGPTQLAFAVLVTANLVSLPYLFDYEFALVAAPLAILASDMDRRGAPSIEKIALLFIYIMPFFAAPFAGYSHVQIGFLVLVLCLALCVKRSLRVQEQITAQAKFACKR